MVEKRKSAPVQVNLRLSETDVAALDRWLHEINADRWPEINRSDLLRLLLRWGLDARPSITSRGALELARDPLP
jgi:hypothetical protein